MMRCSEKSGSCVARLYNLAQLPGPAYKLQYELGVPQASAYQGPHISQWHVQAYSNRVRDCSERPSCDNNPLLLLDIRPQQPGRGPVPHVWAAPRATGIILCLEELPYRGSKARSPRSWEAGGRWSWQNVKTVKSAIGSPCVLVDMHRPASPQAHLGNLACSLFHPRRIMLCAA
jgi:hypothetical protein